MQIDGFVADYASFTMSLHNHTGAEAKTKRFPSHRRSTPHYPTRHVEFPNEPWRDGQHDTPNYVFSRVRKTHNHDPHVPFS